MYEVIYADPPWSYRDTAADGCRGAGFKYPVMRHEDICRLPVWSLANPESCLLAMWWVPTQPEEALTVMKAWGFRLITMKGFTWHKTNKHKGNSAIGMGHLTRANSEDCLFAVRGRLPARLDASICQHVTAPRGGHSTKPAVFREMLQRLVGEIPRIELFARGEIPGWDCWGNECDSDIQVVPGTWNVRENLSPQSSVSHDMPTSKIWSAEVNQAFAGVPGADVIAEHLQSKLKANINRLLLEGRNMADVISTASALVVSMEARA
ncbi:hypothetical protein RRR72_001368 [Citrobacter freundii]|nr:hypothetical protein [Citrobacter freundii]